MENRIGLFYRNENEGAREKLTKIEIIKKIIELFETEEVKNIEIIYEKREPVH